MINGLFLDPRSWNIDFMSSKFWKPKQYGVKIDLHKDAFNIPKKGVPKKYKFVIATEIWEEPMRDTLQYLHNKGLKIFFMPRESMTFSKEVLFQYDAHLYNDNRYFVPDVLLAPNILYYDLWEGKVARYLTGHPKFDYYIDCKIDKPSILEKYKLSQDKTLIFFPSYPPTFYQKKNGKDNIENIFNEREQTLKALEKFATNNDAQIVVKVHPTSFKNWKKNVGIKRDMVGVIKKYYDTPEPHFKVLGDDRMVGIISRELLVVSDIVVGYTSTMLVEATLLNKPVLHVQIGNCQKFRDRPKYEKVFDTAFDVEEISNKLSDIVTKLSANYEMSNVERFLYKVDGKCCERVCNAIKEVLKY